MSQISRPFQIALLAVAVLGAAWLFVFQPHTSNTASSSSSSAVVSSPPPAASAQANGGAGSPSKIYHGSAPGVQGLTRAIAKAHGAVATSEQNAAALEHKSAQASEQAAAATASGTPTSAHVTKSAAAPAKHTSSSRSGSKPAAKAHTPAPARPHHAAKGIPSGQRTVEAQLAHGNVVVLLFWNRNGADDKAVRRAVQSLHHGKVAIDVASASQAATFGSVTRGVQVYGTPTTLVIDRHGKAIVLNGLQDAFAIQQAVAEARHAA